MERNLTILTLVGLVGAACVGPEPVLPTNCTMCKDLCVDFQVDPGHCGGCDTRCPAGAVCLGGKCGVGQAYPSLISPGTDAVELPVKRPESLGQKGQTIFVNYRIGTPFPATIYYRTDGAPPQKGAAGTLSAPSPVELSTGYVVAPPSPDLVVQWFAEYTLPDGSAVQEAPHRYHHQVDRALEAKSGQRLHGGVQFAANKGPSLAVSPGEEVTGEYTVQVWRAPLGVGCAAQCAVVHTLWLEDLKIDCAGDPAGFTQVKDAVYPGGFQTRGFKFTAPTTKGRYRVRSQVSSANNCSQATPGGEIVGELLVL